MSLISRVCCKERCANLFTARDWKGFHLCFDLTLCLSIKVNFLSASQSISLFLSDTLAGILMPCYWFLPIHIFSSHALIFEEHLHCLRDTQQWQVWRFLVTWAIATVGDTLHGCNSVTTNGSKETDLQPKTVEYYHQVRTSMSNHSYCKRVLCTHCHDTKLLGVVSCSLLCGCLQRCSKWLLEHW